MSDAAAVGTEVSDEVPPRAELAERLARLEKKDREKESRIEDLECELQIERERRKVAEERAERAQRAAQASISLIRQQLHLDDHQAKWNLAGTTVGHVLQSRASDSDVKVISENVDRLWDTVDDLIAGEMSGTDLVGGVEPELPIEEDVAKAKDDNLRSDLSANELRAVQIFRAFGGKAKSWSGTMKIDSADVRQILEENGESDVNDNTPKRAMRMLAKKTADLPKKERDPRHEKNLMVLAKGDKRLELHADKEEWLEYMQNLEDRYSP